MADVMGVLLPGLTLIGAKKLIAFLKMEDVVEFVMPSIGFATILLGAVSAWKGWL